MNTSIRHTLKTGAICLTLICTTTLGAQVYPNFKINNPGTTRNMASGGSVQIPVDVELMQDHHIYVRHASSMSFNIVTSFSADAKKGFAVEATRLPDGRRYKDDYVLDGKGKGKMAGRYMITIYETRGIKPGPRAFPVKVSIKTQSCNQKTNICYRPKTFIKIVNIKITKQKIKTALRSSSRIKWVSSITEAKRKAKSSGKNIYTIVTAPTWCGYCKQMERTTFQDDRVVAALNNQFIPLQILDTSPDIKKIRFSGFPTHMIQDKNFRELKRGMSRQADSLVSSLQQYATGGTETEEETEIEEVVEEIGGTTYTYTLTIKGRFENQGNGNWISTDSRGQKQKFKESKRGKKHIILKNTKTKVYVAVPIKGGQGYIYKNSKWVPYFKMQAP